ncbi:MAG: hypothetical protein LBH52_03825 [Puniceicoccales bacterium]|jgi:hypothetical protein|nr:hypothetical protein [Puniceicoccales bacterium]
MKIIFRWIFILSFSGCIVCYGGNTGSHSESDSEELSPQAVEQLSQQTAGAQLPLRLPPKEGDNVACFVLNVKQGNCVFLRGPSGTVVVDAGTQIPGRLGERSFLEGGNAFQKWNDFKASYQDVIEWCFTGAGVVSFVITHLDVDHYLYIPFLAKFAAEQGVPLNFFIGVTQENEIREFLSYLQQLRIPQKQYQIFGHRTPTRRDKNNVLSEEEPFFPNWKHFFVVGKDICTEPCPVAVVRIERTLTATLGSECASFHTLIPINGLTHPTDRNAQSLVLLFEHQGSNILFTGDATEDTLKAILGNRYPKTQSVDEEVEQLFLECADEQAILHYDRFSQDLSPLARQQLMHTLVVSAISKRNRCLLGGVNLIMEPHHGSDQEGSNFWLPTVIKMSGWNFCGSICSADALESIYGHPKHSTSWVDFPPSARGPRKPVLTKTPFKGGHERDRFITKRTDTSKHVFQTALVDVYQFLFTDVGMLIRYHDIVSQLTSTRGLSLYSRNLWDVFLQGPLQFFTLGGLRGAFLTNRNIFATRSIQNIPTLLVVFHLLQHTEDKQLFLDNVRSFCDQLKSSPVSVFGVSPDMLASIGIPFEQETEERPIEFLLAEPEPFIVSHTEPTPPTNYKTINVPPDGNCGIAAVLCGLGLQASYDSGTILDLRTRAADLVPSEDDGLDLSLVQAQKTRIAGWKKWLAIEDFQYIAQVIERPIVVITDVDNVWNYYRFEVGRPGANGSIPGGLMGAEAILDQYVQANDEPLFVYHQSKGDGIRHFQALVHK